MGDYYVREMLESNVGTEDFTGFGNYKTVEDAQNFILNDLAGLPGDISVYTIIKCVDRVETLVKSFVYTGKTLVAEVTR